jgi:phage/plasmid-associated DNA primase
MTILAASKAQTTDFSTRTAEIDREATESAATTPMPCEDAFVDQRQEVVDWLVENGFPALPVAPKQDPFKYPKKNKKGEIEYEEDGVTPKSLFTGKNPSYLDKAGIPHLVFHTKYQTNLPSKVEFKKWFANPINGIGTLGGWNNAVWIDFDIKHFDSEKECEDAAMKCIDKITQESSEPFIEKTHSGGWRIGVSVVEPPDFTNFCIEENGKQVGEALFKGRFTVLAPTIGVSGNSYENLNRVKLPVISSLEAIGIYPTSQKKEEVNLERNISYTQPQLTNDSISLEDICSRKSKDVLSGTNTHDDRSKSLTMAIREWYGWLNWGNDNNVSIYGSVESLAIQAGQKLGIDDDRILRILKTVDNPNSCECAAFHNGGDKSCWKKVRHYNRKTFDIACPKDLKQLINEEASTMVVGIAHPDDKVISAEEYQKRKKEKANAVGEDTTSVAVFGNEDIENEKTIEEQIDKVAEVAAAKNAIKKLEKQFKGDKSSKKKKKALPPEDLLGSEIGERYFEGIKYDDANKRWMVYDHEFNGVWSEVSETYIEKLVNDTIEAEGIIGYGTNSYIKNIVAKLRYKVYESKWNERDLNEAIPFSDCVFNLKTNQKEEHSPNNRFTWVLPRNYSIIDYSWNKIGSWFDEVTYGNQKLKEILVCFAAAMLRGRSDLQKFIHLMGDGGTGKSSYTRLLINLIGKQNVWSGAIEDLRDQHRVIELRNKRLALFPDQEKVLGSLKIFKNITGEDGITGRELYKPSVLFQFYGMVAVTSNGPIFHAPGSSWLSRRLLSMPFQRKPKEIKNLDAEFAPELSAFTNYLLSIPDEEITRVLQGLGKTEATATSWEMLVRTDSVASFVNDMVIYDANHSTQIGKNKNEWKDREYDSTTSTLYGAYCNHCFESGLQPKSKNTFSSDLQELIKRTLLWEGVEVYRAGSGYTMMRNIRLRNDDEHGTILESLEESGSIDNTTDNNIDNLQTLTEQAFDSSITKTPCLSEIDELLKESLFLSELWSCDNTLNISKEGSLISETLQTSAGKGFGVIEPVISEVIEGENNEQEFLEVTDTVENPDELELPPQEYAIVYGNGRVACNCVFVQKLGNVCLFDCNGDAIAVIVDENGNFEGNVVVKKME